MGVAGRLSWPLPALLAWGAAWALYALLGKLGLGSLVALAAACLLGIACSVAGNSWWRRAMIAGGFPVSLLALGTAGLPPWGWLVPLALLGLIYPLNAWRDAPLFPTPANALQQLGTSAPLEDGALVLDAGCGLGHGLRALHAAYPRAQLHGIEWSWPLRAWSGLRCPWARVRRGDIWRARWKPYAVVYLFQRPESMPRAVAKAATEMQAGSWLVSLEFEARELVPHARLAVPDGRPLWLYRIPFSRRPADVPPIDHK